MPVIGEGLEDPMGRWPCLLLRHALLITQTEGGLQSLGRPVIRARRAHRLPGALGQSQGITELSLKNSETG